MRRFLFALLFLSWSGNAWAASCCGGGGSASLILPKFMPGAYKLGLEQETYQGYWNGQGEVTPDPPGSKLQQTRLGFGYANRLNDNWQASVTTGYVLNQNRYSGVDSQTQGLGDSQIGLLYENFDQITCVYEIHRWEDWKPASYFGLNLVVPTGVSPHDEVESSFDITGRGFYRLDATAQVEKTIYPLSASLSAAYGVHLPRMVNREYGQWIEPYKKQLGNRHSLGSSLGYTWFMENIDQLTLTLSRSRMQEGDAHINGATNPDTGIYQNSWGMVGTYMKADQSWIVTLGLNQGINLVGQGENFPITRTLSLGVSHVFHH